MKMNGERLTQGYFNGPPGSPVKQLGTFELGSSFVKGQQRSMPGLTDQGNVQTVRKIGTTYLLK